MKIKRFEDIESGKAGRELIKYIYKLTGKPAFNKYFGLKEQIQKALVRSRPILRRDLILKQVKHL